jgi:hypothetical protein
MSRKFALIIGNSRYEDPSLARLKAPGADVTALARLLQDPQVGAFDQVTTLVDRTFADIQPAIASFFIFDKKPDDLLLLYFSGHGVLDEQGRLYLAVRNTQRTLLSGTAVAAAFISEEMDRSRSKRQVMILDCCHSGAFARGTKGVTGASVGTATAFAGVGFGRVVLTATDATQYAWEGDKVIGQALNSVFTHYVIQGLQTGEADLDGDGRVTLDELYDYVFNQVRSVTPQQTPNKFSFREQGELVIAQNPRPRPAELPADLQELIRDHRPPVRETAVKQLERLLQDEDKGLVVSARQELERLAHDDSRMVSEAARQALAANPPAFPQPRPQPRPVPLPPQPIPPQPQTGKRRINWWAWGCIALSLIALIAGACVCGLFLPGAFGSGSGNCYVDPFTGLLVCP